MTQVGNQFWEEGDSGMAKEVLLLVEEAAEVDTLLALWVIPSF